MKYSAVKQISCCGETVWCDNPCHYFWANKQRILNPYNTV